MEESTIPRRYPKKHNACWRLFNYRYPVWYPKIFMYDPEYIAKRGYAITGDPTMDRQRLMESDIFRQSPAGMAMLIDDGAPIDQDAFHDAADIPYVYQDIQEHLMDWEREINRGIHINDCPPLEDFYQLENLAMILHPTAMRLMTEEESSGSGILDKLREMNRRRSSIVRKEKPGLNDQGEVRPYVSIVERIAKEYHGGNVWQ